MGNRVETNDSMHKNNDLTRESKFWKKCDRISFEHMNREADSGDILLFTGKTFSSKMTRKLTNSEYDHVAMVITFEEDADIHFLEATSQGVHIVSWREMSKYFSQMYSKIVWRKLYADRDDEF
jgi:hypothetical protein